MLFLLQHVVEESLVLEETELHTSIFQRFGSLTPEGRSAAEACQSGRADQLRQRVEDSFSLFPGGGLAASLAPVPLRGLQKLMDDRLANTSCGLASKGVRAAWVATFDVVGGSLDGFQRTSPVLDALRQLSAVIGHVTNAPLRIEGNSAATATNEKFRWCQLHTADGRIPKDTVGEEEGATPGQSVRHEGEEVRTEGDRFFRRMVEVEDHVNL
jgi:hypothetical protein